VEGGWRRQLVGIYKARDLVEVIANAFELFEIEAFEPGRISGCTDVPIEKRSAGIVDQAKATGIGSGPQLDELVAAQRAIKLPVAFLVTTRACHRCLS